ncbi:hypothetical protein Q8A73_005954 [Channa argus]|nr:hypothetical protein Q8A73_005954 [Channa argus]
MSISLLTDNTKEWRAAISCVSSITNEVWGEREKWRERGKEAACMSTLRKRQRGNREVCDGRVENGGDGVHWKRRRRRRGVVLQWREVRGDCSLRLWERSDCYHSSEEL